MLFAGVALFVSSCGIFGVSNKPNTLNPIMVFGEGASFLENASTLAIKGRIEFEEGRYTTQSGTFQLFLNGPDSASFLIEGPFGADAFKMVILDDQAHVLTDKGWMTLQRDEQIAVAEYGIENISPFLIGPVIFPQYYPADITSSEDDKTISITIDEIGFSSSVRELGEYFNLIEPETGLVAEYTDRKNHEDGFYPSRIEAFRPDSNDWKIVIKIGKIRKDPVIPPTVWATE